MGVPAPGQGGHLAGAVLAGGASRRMGRDKAFIEIEGVAMVRRVADAMRAAGLAPVFAVGGDASGLTSIGLEVVDDVCPGEGPVGGLVTAFAHVGESLPVCVVACDLPWLDEATVRSIAQPHAGADVIVAITERIEPLCALWMPSAASVVAAAFAEGERAVHRVLDQLRVHTVAVDRGLLVNVNTPDDLARACAARGRAGR